MEAWDADGLIAGSRCLQAALSETCVETRQVLFQAAATYFAKGGVAQPRAPLAARGRIPGWAK